MLIVVNGVITRSYKSGLHDRMIHIVTEDRGRLSVMVKGGASPKSGDASAACLQLFTYGNFELYSKKEGDLYWFRGGSIIHSFYGLTGNLPAMALATYLCDVASELSDQDAHVGETAMLMRVLLNSLHSLDKNLPNPHAIVKAVFELRAMALMGYLPDVLGCEDCGEHFPEQSYFHVMNGSFICADCQASRNRLPLHREDMESHERHVLCPMSSAVLEAIRFALSTPVNRLFAFALKDPEDELAFARLAESYLLHHLERDFKSLEFYRSVIG